MFSVVCWCLGKLCRWGRSAHGCCDTEGSWFLMPHHAAGSPLKSSLSSTSLRMLDWSSTSNGVNLVRPWGELMSIIYQTPNLDLPCPSSTLHSILSTLFNSIFVKLLTSPAYQTKRRYFEHTIRSRRRNPLVSHWSLYRRNGLQRSSEQQRGWSGLGIIPCRQLNDLQRRIGTRNLWGGSRNDRCAKM